jgi:hypothetical protein
MNTSDWSISLSESDVLSAAVTLFQPMVDTAALRDRMARAAGILRSLPELPTVASLICEMPDSEGHVVVTVSGELTIGRHEECDVSIPECTALSRQHFQIRLEEGVALIKDLGSSNGTRVNDPDSPPIRTRVLRDGDFVLAGGLAFLWTTPTQE